MLLEQEEEWTVSIQDKMDSLYIKQALHLYERGMLMSV